MWDFCSIICAKRHSFAKEDPKSSTIGGMEINDVKTADLATTLQNAISEWQGSEVEIVSDGISKPLTRNNLILI